jgi:hypothetical protein
MPAGRQLASSQSEFQRDSDQYSYGIAISVSGWRKSPLSYSVDRCPIEHRKRGNDLDFPFHSPRLINDKPQYYLSLYAESPCAFRIGGNGPGKENRRLINLGFPEPNRKNPCR